jgi:hypothetical protein
LAIVSVSFVDPAIIPRANLNYMEAGCKTQIEIPKNKMKIVFDKNNKAN